MLMLLAGDYLVGN